MMKELGLIERLPRLACAQSDRANPLYLSFLSGYREFKSVKAQKTLASAIQIGEPVSYERALKVLRVFDGIVEQVSEDELASAAAKADQTGLFSGPQTGVAIAALIKLIERKEISSKDRVVVISTANGLKFTDFKVRYHDSTLDDVTSHHANPPLELPADIHAVNQAISRKIEG
jgi:threonine synthase